MQHQSVAHLFHWRLEQSPEQTAFTFPDKNEEWQKLTWAQVGQRVRAIACGLRALGIADEQRVGILSVTRIEWILADLGILCAGAATTTVYPSNTAEECQFILSDSATRIIFAEDEEQVAKIVSKREELPELTNVVVFDGKASADGFVITLQQLEERGRAFDAENPESYQQVIDGIVPERLATLIYTSGTTGRPKGVMLSHRSILQVTFNLMMEVGPRGPGEKILLMQPMSHGAGFFVLPWFLRGGACVVMPRFDPCEVLRLVREVQIETVKLVPTMLQRILACDSPVTAGDLPWLRQIIYGASPMPIEALRAGLRRFGNCFVQIYGQSEAPVTITVMHAVEHATEGADAARLASAGMAWPTVELRIVDPEGRDLPPGEVGEVLVRAPQVMAGYWNRPELTRTTLRDGWLHTRDLGRMDEQGFLFLIGRLDDMIISGGYNIAPREVEEVLYRHPAVREAAVIGEPDADWGAAVVAYVVLGSPVSVEELHSFARSEIGFKSPKRFYRLAELPKNANGKIQKIALTADVALPWKAPAE